MLAPLRGAVTRVGKRNRAMVNIQSLREYVKRVVMFFLKKELLDFI
jgi:hypothetical protein